VENRGARNESPEISRCLDAARRDDLRSCDELKSVGRPFEGKHLARGGWIQLRTGEFGGLGEHGVAASGEVGGLFGLYDESSHDKGMKLRHKAQQQIDQVERAYDAHQLDYTSAISQLEQMNTQLNKQLHSHGDQLNYHGFGDAEQHIYQEEMERQRRAALVFGPAQFAGGGIVDSPAAHAGSSWLAAWTAMRAPAFASGGAVPILAHMGEGIVNERGMQRLGRPGLDAINRSESASISIPVTVNAMDAKSFGQWFAGERGREMLRLIRRAAREGY